MKTKVLIFLLLILTIQIFAESYKNDFVHMHYEDCFFFYSENGKIHFINTYDNIDIDLTSSIKRNENGFYELQWNSESIYPEPKKGIKYNVIFGSNYLFFLRDVKEKNFKHFSENIKNKSMFDFEIKGEYFLEETINKEKISYSPENLKFKFSSMYDVKNDFQSGTLPWAVNKESINKAFCEIKFKKTVKGFVFLNGYVDMQKQSLYYKNARAKEIKILDLNTKQESIITLIDDLIYQDVSLPFETDSVRIEILSYYEGNKYDDICISAIYPCYVNSRDYIYTLEKIWK